MANPPTASNVKLLCHFDGTNGQTTTVDSSVPAKVVSRVGTATLATTPAKFGSAVSTMGGTNCWSAPETSDWDFGTGAFTVEAFVRFTTVPSSGIYSFFGIGIATQWGLSFIGPGTLSFGYPSSSLTGSWTPTTNTWYHLCAERDASNTLRLYVDGVVLGSKSVAGISILGSGSPLYVGGVNGGNGGPSGFFEEARIVKGEAVYGSAFTPPTAALPNPGSGITPAPANVKLLLHFDGTHGQGTTVDSSTFARSVTAGTGAVLSTTQVKYGTASSISRASGSVKWNVPDSPDWHFGAGPFTIEGWVYFTAVPTGVHSLVSHWGGTGNLSFFFGHVSGALAFYYSTTGSDNPNVGASWSPTLNTWYHIAVDRDVSNVLRVYLNGVVHASATVTATLFNSPYLYLEVAGNNTFLGIEGFVDDVRIVKGEAVYGGPFTPPTGPLPDPGVVTADPVQRYVVNC